jgi:hypothetical protein
MRGIRQTKSIEEVQRCTEKSGYHSIKNTDAVWQFDAFMFRPAVIAAIKIKKIRHAIDENGFVEKYFLMKSKIYAHSYSPACTPRALDTDAERAGMAPVLYPAGDNCRD